MYLLLQIHLGLDLKQDIHNILQDALTFRKIEKVNYLFLQQASYD